MQIGKSFRTTTDTLRLFNSDYSCDIMCGEIVLMHISDLDGQWSGLSREELAKILEQKVDTVATEVTIDRSKKVMRGGYKINGYRVQAFAGGNQRTDRQKAEQIGNTIKNNFPNEPIYVHFYSPRWICRVGNYRTYEEARQMLNAIRKLGISGASIVKGKITVSNL